MSQSEGLSITREGRLLARDTSSTVWSVATLRGMENLTSITGVAVGRGWIGSDRGHIYRTEDGGATWLPTAFTPPLDSEVADIYFSSGDSGWLVLRAEAPDELDYKANTAWIFATVDGGKTWTQQFTQNAAMLHRLYFINPQEGWAVGSRFFLKRYLQGDHFILHTMDQGRHWTDASERLNAEFTSHDPFIVDVSSSRPAEACVLTIGGEVFRTNDAGKNWTRLKKERRADHVGFYRLGPFGGGAWWILGGADAMEGMAGVLGVSGSDGNWVESVAGSVFLEDAVYLPNGDFLACGSVAGEGKATLFGPRSGVILRSADKGATWTVTYKNGRVRRINAITAPDPQHVWAVGDDCLVVRLNKSGQD